MKNTTSKKPTKTSSDALEAIRDKCKSCEGICTEACPLYELKEKFDDREKDRRAVVGFWMKSFEAKFGRKYAMTPAEQKAAKELIECCGDLETVKMSITGFMEDDFWTSPRIGLLVKHANRYMPVKRRGDSHGLQVRSILRRINANSPSKH